MKLLSWNVNGIRAAIKKGFMDFMQKENPDILCIQESKGQTDILLPEYKQYWNLAEKPGYSGTVIFTKNEPLSVTKGMNMKEHDSEGRIVTLEFENFILMNVYSPHSQRELARHTYKLKWDKDLLQYMLKLEKKKPLIVCGDLNIAHKPIDLTNPGPNKNNAGFTIEERKDFDTYLDAGFIDTFREFNKDPEHYTWWSYMHNARARNIGWRIDYFLISPKLRKELKTAFILKDVLGSDHCPVGIEINPSQ